jgi:nitrite reductase (NADH) large subunit
MNMIVPRRLRLIVIGNGMGGIRTLEEIFARAREKFEVTVFGAEPHGNYNRIMLSPVLAGEKTFADIVTHDRAWYENNGVELIAGETVISIDREQKTAVSSAGTTRGYDILLLATGSVPFILPVPGANLPGVVGFRDIADVQTMLAASSDAGSAIVIGGGLLGLEAAYGLKRCGMNVTVIHLMAGLMERQIDQESAALLKSDLQSRGIEVLTEANTAEILGTDKVTGLRLKDGREIDASLVVMAAGIRPNSALAKRSGLDCGRGIIVDDGMRTSDDAIFAIGECVEHRGQVFGLIAPIWDMAKICADHITGVADSIFSPAASMTRLKVTGIDMMSAGDFLGNEQTETIVFRDPGRGINKRFVIDGNVLAGVVLYGDASDGAWYFDLLKQKTDISAFRELLAFGPAIAGNAAPASSVASLPDTTEICGCNGVCKGTIMAAIAEHGLSTVDEIKTRTKASASCGGCAGQVEALLNHATGKAASSKPADKALCKCTNYGHDAVRAAIRERGFRSITETMRGLEWSTEDGCASCRPALNYYLLCERPGDYSDDSTSRFVNERLHANIQKDGTYSVIPRMWGGMTSAAELRAIADVVDKYKIPAVKVTGGQRIDMLGVTREQLPHVWRDLNAAGMVSGHAYGKALRTVKTCVGSEWCRFGTQDSTGMGIALEKMTWGSWTPAKVKLAVSGCPRNCAEATIKDFGVIAVESGWELHVGGNGGIKLRGTELLGKVTTDQDVLEYCGAFMQLYREEARYLERTAHWIERIGLDYVRARIVQDADSRAALHARFLYSQGFAQIDPWAERAAGKDEGAFSILAEVE